jgi:tetratricopeptide (TPR) repeat protein/tRNA A-37 threonylcarbamoyl transferase component Bud32
MPEATPGRHSDPDTKGESQQPSLAEPEAGLTFPPKGRVESGRPTPTQPPVQPVGNVHTVTHDDTGSSFTSYGSLASELGTVIVGRYTLVEVIGEGGMGIVYRATDSVLGREVAVKVLQKRYGPESGGAQRFGDEARITSQLQHPSIPPVHELGALPDGRPFLAMKLIKGNTLDAILKYRADPVAERGRLLAVFEAVCQAVGYAHAHRVIHRDLKPANVMVGAFGEVQVMDWGLAKVLGTETPATADPSMAEQTRAWTQVSPTPEAGSHTQAGSMVGTPAFIPPEQAGGEIERVDERADVFGLGAFLTVILTGKPPYVGETAESVRLLAVRGNLEDCFTRLDNCAAEPELIALCKRCLAFEPADRPRDGGEVAQAVAGLRSAAEERARTAERDSVAADARTEEQRRRRRWQFAAAGVVVLALAGGILGLGMYLRDLAAKNRELAAANERERQRFTLAVDAIGLLTGNIGQDMLMQQKEFEGLRTKLLKGAADFYAKLETQLKDRNDPASRAALGRAYFELGELTDQIGSKQEALAIHRKALAIRRELAATAGADVETRLDVARSLFRSGWLHYEMGDVSGEVKAFEEQVAIAKALEAESPTDAVRIVLAQGHLGISYGLDDIGKPAEGLVSYKKARAIQQKLADEHPSVTQFQSDLGATCLFIPGQLSELENPAEWLAAAQAARTIFQKLANADPTATEFQFGLARSHHLIGWWLYLLGQTSEGLASSQTAGAILQKLADNHRAVSVFQYRLARNHIQTGEVLIMTGKPVDGLPSVLEGQAILKKLANEQPKVSIYVSNLMYSRILAADALRRLGRWDEARADCQAAVAGFELLANADPRNIGNRTQLEFSLRVLGLIRLADGDAAGAVRDIRRALKLNNELATRSGEMWFEMACCHAALSALAGREGSGIPAADKAAEADQAMALLKKTFDTGYRADTFRFEPALDPLREREDFKKLIAELEKNPTLKEKP